MKKVNKTVDKRQKDIQKKLSAAILMLLVSSIMMVSSTYAWFTLSTAPEVTGIQTTIGGNGNLEIALATTESWTGDGPANMTTDVDAESMTDNNMYWGNLVDLSDDAAYGLNKVVLYPTALNVDPTAGTVGTSLLKAPQYGADGRVSGLTNTASGTFDNATQSFAATDATFGVRGIGVSSNVDLRSYTYKLEWNNIKKYENAAVSQINGAIAQYGKVLGQLAITKAINGDSASYTEEDVNNIENFVNKLKTATDNFAPAIMSALKATAASKAMQDSTITDENFEAVNAVLNTLTISDLVLSNGNTISVVKDEETIATFENEGLYESIQTLTVLNAAFEENATGITSAKAALATKETISWNELQPALGRLINLQGDNVTVGGQTMGALGGKAFTELLEIFGPYMKTGVPVVVGEATNADGALPLSQQSILTIMTVYVGKISATTTVNYSGMDVPVVLEASCSSEVAVTNTGNLTTLYNAVKLAGAPASATNVEADAKLDDIYAFALDLFFRTNASGSSLLLQQDGIQRIYGEETNYEETQGSGSTMTFSTDVISDEALMLNLMKNIRVAFISQDTGSAGTILAKAGLDLGTTTNPDTNDVIKNYTVNTGSITAELCLLDDNNRCITGQENQVIRTLTQNTAHKITVVVYLDGETITNVDVANALTSSTVSINLQFSSNATLIPMNYSSLKPTVNE